MEEEQQCCIRPVKWGPQCPNRGVPTPGHKVYLCKDCAERLEKEMMRQHRQKLINRHLYN